MSKLTNVTANFYDEYPFPRLSSKKILSSSKKINDALIKMGFPKQKLNRPITVLDAGCGTGSFALSFGHANPNSKVIAFNISGASLKYAENQAKSLKIKNIRFIKADIFNLPNEVTSVKYDLGWSRGVLHCTHDPKLALEIISRLVKSQNFMVIGLYHKGRYLVTIMRLILKILSGGDIKKKIKFARLLFPKHCENHISKGFDGEPRSRELEDTSLADKFAVPKESHHSFLKTNIEMHQLGFQSIYKNASLPKKRIRREKVIYGLLDLFPFLSKSIKNDLVDDISGITLRKEMLLIMGKKKF